MVGGKGTVFLSPEKTVKTAGNALRAPRRFLVGTGLWTVRKYRCDEWTVVDAGPYGCVSKFPQQSVPRVVVFLHTICKGERFQLCNSSCIAGE